MIDNRPKILFNSVGYNKLPDCPFTIDYSNLPSLLKFDMLTLFGIQPVIMPILEIRPGLVANPTQEEIEYYNSINASFQIIHIVVNLHSFIMKDGIAYGQPYAINIVPGPKRGNPDLANIELLSKLDLGMISEQQTLYTDFNAFKGVYGGFWGKAEILIRPNQEIFLDTIGFVSETYFLNIKHNQEEILMPGVEIPNEKLNKRYRKLRVNKYYKPFENINPRKVWGADSPIELFLIQGLAQYNIYPIIQTSVYKDGSIYPNFYDVVDKNANIDETDLITDVDLFFPDKKVAIFCDSTKHHRSKKAKNKDFRIVDELEKLNIKSIRISGKTIVDNLELAVEKVLKEIN